MRMACSLCGNRADENRFPTCRLGRGRRRHHLVAVKANRLCAALAGYTAAEHDAGHDHQGPQGVTASGFLYVPMGR